MFYFLSMLNLLIILKILTFVECTTVFLVNFLHLFAKILSAENQYVTITLTAFEESKYCSQLNFFLSFYIVI